jgi:hypothetical protein
MRIRDITVADILERKNWRLSEADLQLCCERPLEEWGPLAEVRTFAPSDHVVYSGITVYGDGRVKPIVCVREVQYLDYGGDYCELAAGGWRQIGLVPNPDAEVGETYIGNPLPSDPSFDAPDHDHRQYHRDGFARHAHGLRQ